jgi:heme/copper-type cytochrome/quinol oxidase subunit 2
MIGILFVYSFMAGGCYVVGLSALNANAVKDKYRWLNRPLALIAGLVWPVLFLFFIAAKTRRAFAAQPNPATAPPILPADNEGGSGMKP